MIECVALGEVMLRFDPGDCRLAEASTFRVWEGGGEYNVARGLSRCFGHRTAIVTALVDNGVGRLLHNRITAGGVDTRFISWRRDDGIGESCRNGIYFLERGFGLRPPLGFSDRGHSAISQLLPGAIDWELLFRENHVRWFHTGGIMAGLSPHAPTVIAEAMHAAHRCGVTVSYDLNYRVSLWQRFGGKRKAEKVNAAILPQVDVLFGVESLPTQPTNLDPTPFCQAITAMAASHPNLTAIATTIRIVHSASCHDWSGLLWRDGHFTQGRSFEKMDIFDRVGAGDAFAAGIISGLLHGDDPQHTINLAVAHGALTMTTPGDNSMATQADLEHLLARGDAGVVR